MWPGITRQVSAPARLVSSHPGRGGVPGAARDRQTRTRFPGLWRKDRSAGRHLARQFRELAMPTPFDPDTFRGWLERRTGRRVCLVPVVTRPGEPSGIFLWRAAANYLYYEQQTSPWHQAHILLCLAAHLLVSQGAGHLIDPRLLRDARPQLVRKMLGEQASITLPRSLAEAFAFLALDRAGPGRPPILPRHTVRRLKPLHAALTKAGPQAAGTAVPGVRPAGRYRLHRQVIEIRDAMLALRPYRDPRVASAATAAARASGLTGEDLAAAVEAAILASAIHAKATGHPVQRSGNDLTPLPGAGDMHSEAAWLRRVSRAFSWPDCLGDVHHDGRGARP